MLAGAAGSGAALADSALVAFGGWRSGSGFEASDGKPLELDSAASASLAWERHYDAGRRLQLFASRQATRLRLGAAAQGQGNPESMPLTVTYLHIGGTNYVDGRVGQGAYVSGGLGFTHLSPRLPGFSGRWRWSLGLGAGYEWPLVAANGGRAPALTLRAELRGYATLVNSAGSFFCDGGCTVSIRGDALMQLEAMLGVAYSF